MIAVDTNVLVRFLVRGDDPAQHAKATRLFREEHVCLLATVVLETEWVLRANFGLARSLALSALEALVGLPRLTIPDRAAVVQALGFARRGLDFADALHLAMAGSASEVVTFDRDFAKRAAELDGRPVRML